ncbi:MAG: DUF4367 domain-containing protein [Chloroflexota bacterium]|nr:DUF4367 domain-containing protein [Chloroflexota bacterium]
MSKLERELFEQRLISTAKGLDYPRTPNIATAVMKRIHPSARPRFISRRLAWSLTIMLVLVSSLLSIPTARAAIIEFIQIGIVRIFPRPTEPPVDISGTTTPGSITPMTATASLPSATFIPSLSRIAGETTFADAQQRVSYSILVPAYPPDLGRPNYVFVQDTGGAMTILVWLDPRQPEQVLMSLHLVPLGSWAIEKAEPKVIEETTVNGQRAIWATGPYPLRLRNGDLDFTRIIDGQVLIWADGNLTYRLETVLPLEEAIKIAESLQPIP